MILGQDCYTNKCLVHLIAVDHSWSSANAISETTSVHSHSRQIVEQVGSLYRPSSFATCSVNSSAKFLGFTKLLSYSLHASSWCCLKAKPRIHPLHMTAEFNRSAGLCVVVSQSNCCKEFHVTACQATLTATNAGTVSCRSAHTSRKGLWAWGCKTDLSIVPSWDTSNELVHRLMILHWSQKSPRYGLSSGFESIWNAFSQLCCKFHCQMDWTARRS